MSSKTFPSTGSKPTFDPNASFEAVDESPLQQGRKPAFNPNAHFEPIHEATVATKPVEPPSFEIKQPIYQVQLSQPTFRAIPATTTVTQSVPNEPINIEKQKDQYIPDERSMVMQKKQGEARVRQEKLNTELQSNDALYEKKIREYRRDNYTLENLKNDYKQKGQVLSPQDEQSFLQKEKQRQYDKPITPEDITDFKTGTIITPKLSRKFIKDLNNPEISAHAYKVDKYNEVANDPDPLNYMRFDKIDENDKNIKKGFLVYNPETKQLIKPVGIIGSAIEGTMNKLKQEDKYNFYKNASDQSIIDELESERNKPDTDEPIVVPKGKLAEFVKEGSQMPISPLLAGAIGSLAGPQAGTWAATAVGAYENRKAQFTSTLPQVYNELRNQGVEKGEALRKAKAQAENAQEIGTLVGAGQGLIGAEIGKIPFGGAYNKAIGNTLKQNGTSWGKLFAEGAGQGTIGATGEALKNALAKQAGINRPIDEGTLENFIYNAGMAVGIGGAIKAGKGLSKIDYRNIMHGLSKQPEEAITNTLQEKVQNGEITQKAADETQQRINEYKGLDLLIPDNVSEEARFKIQDKIKKRQEYEKQLETQDKAYHPEIKEKIKALDEEIVNLTKESKEKPIKPESGLTKDQEKEATEIAEEWLHEGIIPNTYEGSIKKDPIGFWKLLSQQAHNTDENWRPNQGPSPEQGMREDLGDTVVDYAKELFPAPEVKETPKSVSVIRSGEIQQHESIPLKQREDEIFYTGRNKKYEDLKQTKADYLFFSKNPKVSEWYGGEEGNVTPAKLDTSNFLDLSTQEKKAQFVRDHFTDDDILELYPDIKTQAIDDRDVRFSYKEKEKKLIDKYRGFLEENRFSGSNKEQRFLLNKIKEKGYSGVKLLDTFFGENDISHVVIDKNVISKVNPSEAGAGKMPPDQIGHVEVSEHGEDTKTAEGKENGVKPTKLSEAGRKEAEELGQYLIDNNKKKVITSEVARAQETANIAAEKANVPVETNPLLNTWDIGKYDGKPEGSFVEEAWTAKPNEAPEGGESFNDFTKRMEQAYQFVKSLPEDNHVVSHSKVMRALEALKNTDGKWTDETTKEFLTNKELPNAVPIEKSNALDVREQATNGEAMGAGNAEPESIAGKEGRIQEVNQGTGKEKVGEPIRIGITHAQMDNIAREFGFDTYEKSPEKVKEWDEQAAKRLQDPNALNDLFTKLRNGDIPDKVETRMMLQYMADLMAKIEKTPLDETLLQQLKRTKDLFNIAGREQGKALVARKGSVPTEETLGDFLIRDMEANKAPLTDKQKETAVNEYNDIKEANEKYQKELERVRAENNKLKAEKEIKKVSAKTKKQPKKDYSTERKEIINDIREKLRKARGETSVVAVPYAKELIAIAPDVAKLVKSLVEEGIEKLPDIVKNIHGQLKEFIPEIKEKDVHDIIAGEYNKKKSKNELSEKLYNLKLEAQLANKLEAKEAGIQPKNERQKIKRNQEIEALRQKIKDFDEEVAKAKRESKEAVKQASKKTPEQIALDTIKTRTKNEIARIEEQLRTGDFTEPEKQPIKLDKEAQDAKDKLWKLKQEREVRLIKEKYKNQSAFDKGKDAVTNVLNAPRSIMSSMDYSAPLRQGLVASVAHPTLAAKAIKYMFKASASQKQFDRWFMDLKDSPDYHGMVDSGLALADPHDPTATAHEEAFMSHLPEKIPGIGRLIKGSERAYTGFLNKMRVDSFRRLTDSFKTDGKTFENSPELYKAAADYVNATTGRGKLPEILEKSSPLLNALFFSPRLIASRLQLLTNPINPNFYRSIPKEVRVQYFKDMAKFVIAGTTILGLAKLAGADVEKDPRSTDFGKIKVGNTRWDIWGGFQQYVRFLTQVITGERKSASSGIVDELSGEGRFGKTRADVTTSFLRGKLAPVPATIWDLLSGRTVVGEKLHYIFTEPTEGRDINLTDEAKKILLPLIYSDIKDAWQQQGWPSIITAGVPSTFGVGVQTFTSDKGGNGGGAGAGGSYGKPTRTKPEKPHKIYR